ncbi:MAG TPA: amino acid adenylation domain-containing protein, partial [Longimicrobium sp.]|nr:amino acid adenylation domain-containing protein [Longimicrobium sp.]
RAQLGGDVLRAQVEHWRAALAGIPPALELPADRAPAGPRTHEGAVAPVAVPPELYARVRALAAATGTTPFMVLLAAWQALLGRWSGQDDVVVGSPVAGRDRAETEGVVGFFVNMLPLRGDLSGAPGFRALLGRARAATLDAYAHQELPFERLVEELKVDRGLGTTPVFQATFALQTAHPGELRLPGVRVGWPELAHRIAKFDVSLDLEPRDGGLGGRLEYATDRFSAATAGALARHYAALLAAVTADPDARVADAELLGPDERARLAEWQRPRLPLPQGPGLLHAAFEARAAAAPDAVAVVQGGWALTYRELDERAGRLAARLRAAGVAPETRVAVLLDRSPEAVAALLGVLKAGGVYVPLEPGHPAERLAWILDDCAAEVLVVRGAVPPPLAGFRGRVVAVEGDALALAPEPLLGAGDAVHPAHLAYVVYTSGSTGRPKGVAVQHVEAAAHCRAAAAEYGLGPGDRVLQFASPGFDVALEQVLAPLSAGARIVLRGEEVPSGAELARLVREQGLTLVNLPTAYWHALAGEADAQAAVAAHARLVLVGAEAMSPEAARRWMASPARAVRLLNGYGPTETIVTSTAAPVPPELPADCPRVPIGRPLPGRTAYVLDAELRPCPVGVPGELCVGGLLARGYLGNPAATARAFVPDPFAAAPGARMYRTGDRARWLPSGELEFLGRLDAQVKVRGFRVEPGEIEAVLRAHPAVRDAAVAAHPGPDGARLAAYWVGDVDAAALREWARARLPEHMVPCAWVALEALPHTPNGKVDVRALPAPPPPRADASAAAPRTPTEQRVAAVFRELLGGPAPGRQDNFFEVGGHSLLATRLVSRVRDAFGVELPVRAVFESSTVAALAERIDAARPAHDGPPPLVPRGAMDEAPLSFAQERMWFLQRMDPGSGAYNMPVVLDLAGPLDVEALRGALTTLVARHEVLRTRFREVDGATVQVVQSPAPFLLPLVDAAPGELERLLDEDARRPFDLEADLPIRAALFRTGAEAYTLALNLHHAAADGWSFGILFRELSALYRAAVTGAAAELPEPALQYADYAVWQRAWLHGAALERQVGHWRQKLAGAPALLELPLDRPRPAALGNRGAVHGFRVPAELAARLAALAREENATPFMAGLAAFQALLGRWARQDDVVVGSPIAGRTRAEVEPVVGLFVNTLALRADLSGRPSYRALLRRVREATLDAYAHQDVPFEKLVDELQVERSLSHAPLFQAMFSLQNAPDAAVALEGVAVREHETAHRTAKFDVSLSLTEQGGELAAWLEYATDLWDAATAERLGAHYLRLLDQATAEPDRPLASLDLAGDDERRALAEWNAAAARPGDAFAPVHEAFAAVASRTPDAVAVAWDGGSLTFAELEARANRLAHHLAAVGVRPGARVALCLERSPEMVVALLAVLKAGAAYVPVDPEYPADRKAHLLRDSGAPVVLTHSWLVADLPRTDARVLALDAEAERIAARPADRPEGETHPDAAAYVIYTSGSTGTPKGVQVPHRALSNHMAWMARAFPLGADGAVLQKTPFGFDASVWEFWAPLTEGGRLVLARPGGHRDPAYLVDALRRGRITHLQLVPSLLGVLVDEPGLEACTDLRRVFCGGEALATVLAERLRARVDVEVVNLYGPTEACIDASFHRCDPPRDPAAAPIGVPVDNTRLYVLDDALL